MGLRGESARFCHRAVRDYGGESRIDGGNSASRVVCVMVLGVWGIRIGDDAMVNRVIG